jgi:hypothetical protein
VRGRSRRGYTPKCLGVLEVLEVLDAFEKCTVALVELSFTPCVNLKAIGAQVPELGVHKV